MNKPELFFKHDNFSWLTDCSVFSFLQQGALSSFKRITIIFMLLVVIPQIVEAGNCQNSSWHNNHKIYTNYNECTESLVNQLCEIRFTELVDDVPVIIRKKLGLGVDNNPVSVSRVVVVWPGNGTLDKPPAMIFSSGYTGSASSASKNNLLNFQSQWPEAIIMYTEGTQLICYDHWNTHVKDQIPFFSPRFPHYRTQPSPTPHTDLNYVDKVTEKVFELFPYDRNKLYAVGHSSGGFFTFSLMEFRRKLFRAFAVLGAFADYGVSGSGDIPSIIKNGQVSSARPVLYMMGTCENEFPWNPAYTTPPCPPLQRGASDRVYWSIRQLTARNGAEVPSQNDTVYLRDMVTQVRDASQPNQVITRRFPPTNPYGAEVLLKIYQGNHRWPPGDTDSSLVATEWVVDFFKNHADTLARVPYRNWSWQIPVVTVPLIF